jgi:hypothetical protein
VAAPKARRVNGFGKLMLLWAIPLNVLAVLWVVTGSSLYPPVDSSAANFLRFVVGPILVVGLTAATILMFVQRRKRGGITAAQAWLQTALWIALFIFGLTFPALEERNGGASVLLRVIGQAPLTSALSGLMWTASTFVAWGTGIALLTLLAVSTFSKRQSISTGPPTLPGAAGNSPQ